MRSSRTTALAMAGVLSLGLLAACSSNDDSSDGTSASATGDEKVTITVAGLKPGAEADAVSQLNERVAAFEVKYPNITVKPQEYNWLASTFTTQLAGGTLPNVFEIPLTDAKTLIENDQLADINDQFKQLPYADQFNPALLEAGTGSDGDVYAIPAKSIYGVALHYNRKLFTQAGLDPDKPPTTWTEVREDAKTIHDKTGVAGYGMMALDNAGGWQLVAGANSRGGTVQTQDGDKYKANLADPTVKAQLQLLHDMRFTDNSILPRVDMGWGEINQAFAAGEIAMYTSGSDVYNALVENNGVTPDWGYGLTAIPTDGKGGALTGGTLAAVTKQSSDAQKDAAIKWIDFWYLAKSLDQEQAVADAKTRNEAKQAVGTPVLPIFSKEQYATALDWVKDYINVPLDDMKGYTDVMFTQPNFPEISASTQETYALLFPIVQAVLTDQNADIDALLKDANTQDQALLDQG
ncbi:ABC transporter substrate-binding protein [Cellulomonas sp. URHD0024]|uniref:ABC transporter substrate-binding protein n=1 Tax=Cellulomonas sp. URHD0024 TaxID=1302620 RepID=UPI00040F8447|nr:extracellular solute-binding protein [Cellulomonas sp. URHD0024]